MTAIDRAFSPADQDRIRAAVTAAEERTSGEIVPYVVEASDGYEGARWAGAALGALIAAVVVGAAQQLADLWIDPLLAPVLRWTLPSLLGVAAGFAAASAIAPLRRLLVSQEVMERRVRRRAAVAFLEEEVFSTRERTGILVFMSLFERRVVVLGDAGINQRVERAEWEGIVGRLVEGIRAGRAGDAMVVAIESCGELLQRRGVEIREDDRDELSNELRSRER